MKVLVVMAFFLSANLYAGGAIGGSTGSARSELLLSLADVAFNVEALPKAYLDSESFRRTQARLSVADTHIVPVAIEGSTVQVRKLKDSIVDVELSKEVLPSD